MKSFLAFTHQNMSADDMLEMADDDVMDKLIASFANFEDEVDHAESKPGKAAKPGKGKVGKTPADPSLLHPPSESSTFNEVVDLTKTLAEQVRALAEDGKHHLYMHACMHPLDFD